MTRTLYVVVIASVLLISNHLLAANKAPVAPQKNGYLFQPGDIISISVWREEELQRQVLVNPDGAISFPLIGVLRAQGETLYSLRNQIIQKLSVFIPEPSVDVSLVAADGNRFYVIGKVARPSGYPLAGPTTVLQALSVAGGMTTFANANQVKIIRRGLTKPIRFKYEDMEAGKNLEQNVLLQSGDVVVVP